MKNKNFIVASLAWVILLLAFHLKPFAYTLTAVDPATGKVKVKLEQSSAQKAKGKTSSVYTISGTASSVRLKISEAVFQTKSDQSTERMNPGDYIVLYKLAIDKKNRTFSTDGSSALPITVASLDYGIYRIGPTNGLIPGEYAFIDKSTSDADGNMTVWTFGID